MKKAICTDLSGIILQPMSVLKNEIQTKVLLQHSNNIDKFIDK